MREHVHLAKQHFARLVVTLRVGERRPVGRHRVAARDRVPPQLEHVPRGTGGLEACHRARVALLEHLVHHAGEVAALADVMHRAGVKATVLGAFPAGQAGAPERPAQLAHVEGRPEQQAMVDSCDLPQALARGGRPQPPHPPAPCRRDREEHSSRPPPCGCAGTGPGRPLSQVILILIKRINVTGAGGVAPPGTGGRCGHTLRCSARRWTASSGSCRAPCRRS